MSKIRIKDIALEAGVSVGTVDRVLHNRGRVAKDVEEKVKEAIRLLNYQPNLAARSLARNRNHKIAVVLPPHKEDEFWRAQRKGVLRALRNTKDVGLSGDIFTFDDRKQGDLLKLSGQLFSGDYEALVIAPTTTEDAVLILDQCDKHSLPYVQINSNIEREKSQSLGYVGQDSFQSGRLAAKLLDLSTQNKSTVAVLHMESDVKNSSHMIAKEMGFLDYFDQNKGYQVITRRIVEIEDEKKLSDQIEYLLASDDSMKGFFVTTSRAHYIVEVLIKLGRSDIVLVGFDLIQKNIDALKSYKNIFLINQNPALQGFYGVMRLFDYILQNKRVDDKKYLPLDVITLENVSNYSHIQDRDNNDEVYL